MKYKKFYIEDYRAIKQRLEIDLEKRIIPLVGVNECGKTTILQAIFCFDSHNDNENNGNHLKNLSNLYETVESHDPIVSAVIETTVPELDSIVHDIIEEYKATHLEEEAQTLEEIEEYEEIVNEGNDSLFTITMIRHLNNREYEFGNLFNKLPEEEQNRLAEEIINDLPYILYNDDFNDRPEELISITDTPEDKKTGWEAIFNRVFSSTRPSYSLNKCFSEGNEKVRKSILSDVETYLNNELTKEWLKFSPGKEEISINLEFDDTVKALKVFLKDELNGYTRHFGISDRSKGFIWYYNFIMKVRFNPKYTQDIKDTVFLLDEPGSYLHETAQESLCKKLKEISESEGVVVYCTHSPKLLIPSVIPLNNIMVVNKTSAGYISAVNINSYKTKTQKNTALQPVYEAIMIPEYETVLGSEKIVCVEGIYDKYAIELFCKLPSDYRIFASVSAESIINNIQFFIAYQKEYVALWDNDTEGKRCYGKAKKAFGSSEENHFLLLPSKDSGKRRMEEMFEQSDFQVLKEKLTLPPSATYETTLLTLYYLDNALKSDILEIVSQQTKNNFMALSDMIKKGLQG